MKITVLVDNSPNEEGKELLSEHGLSLFIEFEGKTYLLDTGKSDAFLKNASYLGLDLKVDYGILSHGHYDHGNGMESLFKVNSSVSFYIRKGTKENLYHKHKFFYKYIGLKKGTMKKYKEHIKYIEGDYELNSNVYLIPHKTPGLEEKGKENNLSKRLGLRFVPDTFDHEQSLVFNTPKGLVIFNSCCHSGADVVLKEVMETFPGQPVYALIGGFHLFRLPDHNVLCFGERLKSLDVRHIYTGHCTGSQAFKILKNQLGERINSLYTGLTIEL